jgi:hypothetical protein
MIRSVSNACAESKVNLGAPHQSADSGGGASTAALTRGQNGRTVRHIPVGSWDWEGNR